ncbi:hypothetical protein ACB098_03G105800 [Castanea mollissima]
MAWRGQLSRNLKELRILLCQTSPASSSTRAFVEKNYKELKTLNPKLPILIRESRGIEPQLWARYAQAEENRKSRKICVSPRHGCREECSFGRLV